MTWGTVYQGQHGSPSRDPILVQDEAIADHMKKANTAFLRALHTGQGSTDLRWEAPRKTHNTGPLTRETEVAARMREKHDFVNTLRVSRDPCPMCNVRGDIGCKHRRAA